jgi:hypothetical protein
MEVNSGGVGLTSELYSANRVLRGSDVMVNNNNVFGGFNQSTSVANYPTVQLSNTQAGKIILVDSLIIGAAQNDLIMLTLNAAELSTFKGVWRSLKDGVSPGTGRLLSQDITLGTGNQVAYFYARQYESLIITPPFPFIISNGGTLTVNGSTNPGTILVTFNGREFSL